VKPGQISRIFGTLTVTAAVAVVVLAPATSVSDQVEEKKLVENARVLVMEYVFPPGFHGEEHEAPVDEFAYVLEGEFAVVTRGTGKRVVRRGEVEWAPRGAIHYSLNETRKPARVLVVLLKEK
jgi:quercetin dioxygenase-like cupin family protein